MPLYQFPQPAAPTQRSLLRPPRPIRGAGRRAANDTDAPQAARPVLSVVVPTCGRLRLLDRCLRALAGQRMDTRCFEIIVVDDRPDAETERVVRDWAARAHPLAVRYITANGPHGPAAARNRGWRAARGE